MTEPEQQLCPRCGGSCAVLVDVDTGNSAHLPDRFMALSPMSVTLTCEDCGHHRAGQIFDLDVNLESGRMEFGRIEVSDD